MSMQVVLAGLFPPRGTAMEWNRRLNWQPIPIFSEPLDEDTVSFDMISFHSNKKTFTFLFQGILKYSSYVNQLYELL